MSTLFGEDHKSSDFMRMNHASNGLSENTTKKPLQSDVTYAETNGVINSVMREHRMVNISRAAIDKWKRPAATLNFTVDEALNIEGFTQNTEIYFIFEIRGDDFVITSFEIKDRVITEQKLQE